MKGYTKTLLELEHKVDLSQLSACTACHAAEFHGTKTYAREAVSRHRAVSADVRRSISHLLARLDEFELRVEAKHAEVIALKLPGGPL